MSCKIICSWVVASRKVMLWGNLFWVICLMRCWDLQLSMSMGKSMYGFKITALRWLYLCGTCRWGVLLLVTWETHCVKLCCWAKAFEMPCLEIKGNVKNSQRGVSNRGSCRVSCKILVWDPHWDPKSVGKEGSATRGREWMCWGFADVFSSH